MSAPLECLHCREYFTPRRDNPGHSRLYCSARCRKTASRHRLAGGPCTRCQPAPPPGEPIDEAAAVQELREGRLRILGHFIALRAQVEALAESLGIPRSAP